MFSSATLDEVLELLGEMEPPAPFRIRVKVLYASSGSVADVFAAAAARGRFGRLTTGPMGFSYQPSRARVDPDEPEDGWDGNAAAEPAHDRVTFAVLPVLEPHVSAVVSVCTRDAWIGLLRAIRGEYPTLVPILLSQRELLGSVAALRRKVVREYDLRVRGLSAKERVEAQSGASRDKTVREWTDQDWDRAMNLVSERQQLVTSISLAFHRRAGAQANVTAAAACRVTKRGEVEVTGRFDLLWRTVVADIAEAGAKKLALYSKRGLRERQYRPAPLEIRYPTPIFDDVAEIRRLVDVLSRFPKSMHAVQHGNPYAYVQVADGYDGSAFDVWAMSDRSVTIVPRLKATEAAVDRLIQHIFEQFREGVVADPAAESGDL